MFLKVRGNEHQHPLVQVGAGCSNNTTCTWAQLEQTLYRHLYWLPSATCAGDAFSSSTGTYCMHILQLALCGGGCGDGGGGDGGGDGMYVCVLGACGDAGCMQMWWQQFE